MTVAEARREYRCFMSRMDVAFAFGHGCSIAGSHPVLRRLQDDPDEDVRRTVREALAGMSR